MVINMAQIRFTITVCSKRHHIRFFPRDGDRMAADNNANSLPGTLVERDVTHPFEYDFCKFPPSKSLFITNNP